MCSARTVILTRPERVAHEFATAMQGAGITCPIVIAPLREVTDLDAAFTVAADETVLISSAEAVRIAGARLKNRRVLAIGAGTAETAQSMGALIDHVSLNARDMIHHLGENSPTKLHVLRGDPYSLDPNMAFGNLGLSWRATTIYRVSDKKWPASIHAQISNLDNIVFPVFSAASWPALANIIDALPSHLRIEILPISQKLREHIQTENRQFESELISLDPPSTPDRAGMLVALGAVLSL